MERPSTGEKILPRMEERRCRRKIYSWSLVSIQSGCLSKPGVFPIRIFVQTGCPSCSLRLQTLLLVPGEPTPRWWVAVHVKRCAKAVTNSSLARRAITCGVMLFWSCTKCQWTPNVFSRTCVYKYNIPTTGFANKLACFYQQLLNNFLTCFWHVFNTFLTSS
jgi:hypothetical protein